MEQRLGRIVRQGNHNPQVEIFRYVTEGTFDSYLYQLVENKQKFIAQIMTSKTSLRAAEDIDESALNYAEIKALATGNPLIIEKCNLDVEIGKLNMLKANHLSQRYSLEDMVLRKYPQSIARLQERLEGYASDMKTLAENPRAPDTFPTMTINGALHQKKESAGKALLQACKNFSGLDAVILGQYRGFTMSLSFNPSTSNFEVTLKGKLSHKVPLGTDVHGNITRIDNLLETMMTRKGNIKDELENTKNQMENAKVELAAPFAKEDELNEKTARLNELNALLNMDQKEHSLVDKEPEESNHTFSVIRELVR